MSQWEGQMAISKKQLLWVVLGAAGLIVIATIWLVVRYFASMHSVYFDLSDDARSVSIYHQGVDGKPVGKEATLSADGSVTLKEGDYLAEATGDNVAAGSYVSFTVYPDTREVNITPILSKSYLESLLTDSAAVDPRKADGEAIKNTIYRSQNLSADIANVAKGELVYDGNWYVGIITTNSEKSRSKYDQYKIILHNDNGEWSVVADQAFVFSYGEYPDIPKEVIQFANKYEI
jgi:hypothetical protein